MGPPSGAKARTDNVVINKMFKEGNNHGVEAEDGKDASQGKQARQETRRTPRTELRTRHGRQRAKEVRRKEEPATTRAGQKTKAGHQRPSRTRNREGPATLAVQVGHQDQVER